jgi:putative tryptophan/tyrosine transport system substrate-binding protein
LNRRDLLILGSTVIAWPRVLGAQEKALPVVGLLSPSPPGASAAFVAAFRQGLGETGYVEGQNVVFELRYAEGIYDRLPALAADLVGRKVDVIATIGPPSALAAKNATSTIPIVFEVGSDPVVLGLVASLTRPVGNLTGGTFLSAELLPKLLQLVSEVASQAGIIAVLVNPHNPNTERNIADVQEAVRAKTRQLNILQASTEDEIDAAFATLVQLRAGALVIAGDPFFNSRTEQLVALASRHAVPAICPFREFAAAGGLISYGADVTSTQRQIGIYAGRILKGEKPADLPVQQPTKFQLVINLKTAATLGLTVPQSLLARADEVIE